MAGLGDRIPVNEGIHTFNPTVTAVAAGPNNAAPPTPEDTYCEPPDVVIADYIQNTFGIVPRALDPDTAAEDHEGMTNVEREAGTPIYTGSSTNRLAFVMELLKVQARNPTMTNQCVDDVLQLIQNFIIDPKLENNMPKPRYEARKIVSDMGLDNVTIHACPCDGMLYYGSYANLTQCPLEGCGLSRYKEGSISKKVPCKVSGLIFLKLLNYVYSKKVSACLTLRNMPSPTIENALLMAWLMGWHALLEYVTELTNIC